jgi:hypothetical protein
MLLNMIDISRWQGSRGNDGRWCPLGIFLPDDMCFQPVLPPDSVKCKSESRHLMQLPRQLLVFVLCPRDVILFIKIWKMIERALEMCTLRRFG